MYGRGGFGPAKQGKILLNLALCPANLYLEVGKYEMAGFLPGYYSSLASNDSKKRYSDKVKLVDGIDP